MRSVPLVAITVFPEVEVLDFAGPFEVFAVAAEQVQPAPWRVAIVAATRAPVRARGGLEIVPAFGFADCPEPEILVVPGGYGTRALVRDSVSIEWIRTRAAAAPLVLSVCTGALVLAAAGLLEGLAATTHASALDRLAAAAPHTRVQAGVRFVDNGRLVTAAGIAAGIDAALHLVARRLGPAVAARTAAYMEYPWSPTTP
jgi:transcriptional regulator GlxA family with amidase domain